LHEAGLDLDSDEIRTPNPDGWFYNGKDWRCLLWAQNEPAMTLYYNVMRTQWREGYSGRTGLDYNVLLHELDRRNLPKDEYDDLFAAVRVIEQTVLDESRSA